MFVFLNNENTQTKTRARMQIEYANPVWDTCRKT